MPRLFRQRTAALRLLLMLAVALCLVLKPALGLAGELHRDLHDLAHQAALDAHGHDDGDHNQGEAFAPALADEAAEHAPADGWHGVLHIDLCCSNVGLPANFCLPAAAAPGQPPSLYRARDRAPAPIPEFLRPPIRA